MAGFISIAIACCYLVIVVALNLMGRIDVAGWTTVVFLVIWFGGMTLLSLGVIGEYLGRTCAEIKRRPVYIVASTTDNLEQPIKVLSSRTLPTSSLNATGSPLFDAKTVASDDVGNGDDDVSRKDSELTHARQLPA